MYDEVKTAVKMEKMRSNCFEVIVIISAEANFNLIIFQLFPP